jgi:Gpi18-like mannosyltransferase
LLQQRLTAFFQVIPVRDIVWLFLITRLALIAITYIAYTLFTVPGHSSTPVDSIALLTSWNRWDALNYVRIAQHGYEQRVDLAFFPLFPFLIAIIGHVLGDWSYLAVGTLISNIALLGAMIITYRLALDAFEGQIAQRTLLYWCIFPTAFFFFAAYNESLLLLWVTGAFLAMQRQRWWLAGLLGLLASLTRVTGILLIIPYVCELWIARTYILVTYKRAILSILPAILIPTGMFAYSIYCWYTVGDPLAFVNVQKHSGRYLSLPWQGIWQAISALFISHPQPFGSSNQAHLLLDLSATLGFIVLVIIGRQRLRLSYTLWMACFLIYILLYPALDKPDILLSNQRFVLEMFPAFFTLAALSIKRPRLHQSLVLLFLALQAVLGIAFLMNRWVV